MKMLRIVLILGLSFIFTNTGAASDNSDSVTSKSQQIEDEKERKDLFDVKGARERRAHERMRELEHEMFDEERENFAERDGEMYEREMREREMHERNRGNIGNPEIQHQEMKREEFQNKNILHLFTYLEVQPDGKIWVTESIKLGRDSYYQDGFVRNFPLYFYNFDGTIINNSINFLSVKFNDKDVNYSHSVKNGNIVLDIDYTSDFFTEDLNTIVITYRLADNLIFPEDGTEMFWQVIGDGWDGRIENLGAAVIFLKDTKVLQSVAFISDKPTHTAFKMVADKEGNIGFVAIRGLQPNEAFTLYAKWKNDGIYQISTSLTFDVILEKYGVLFAFIAAIFSAIIYYVFLPIIIKKDKDYNVARKSSLRSLSPTAVRYVLRNRFDSKYAVISFLDMVIKSSSKIEEMNGEYSVKANLKRKSKLSGISKFLFRKLFNKKNKILNFQLFGKSDLKRLTTSIPFMTTFETELFFIKQNAKFILMGVMFSFLALIGGAIMSNYPGYAIMIGSVILICSYIFVFSTYILVKISKRLKKKMICRYLSIAILSLLSLSGAGYGIYLTAFAFNLATAISMIVIPVIVILVHVLLKSSNITKNYISDSFNGFKALITTRNDISNEKTLSSSFDKYLPYALAMDIENDFADKYPNNKVEYLPDSLQSDTMMTQNLASRLETIIS